MTEKRYELVKDYDCDGNWEYAYQNNETGKRYNFADENCDYDFLNDVNNSYMDLKHENEQLKKQHRKLQIEFNDTCGIVYDLRESKLDLEDENEQLKQTIHHNFMSLDETVEHMNNQYWKYKQLKEENEQLKQQLDYADDLIHSHLSEHFIRQWTNFKMGHKEYNDFWEEKLKKYNELER